MSYRDRLVAFYEVYAPNKVAQVDAHLAKYAGHEEEFIEALVGKYGPEPVATGDDQSSYRDRLVAFYEAYAPNKVGSVDAQLEKYAGKEEELMAALVAKYGPEPTPQAEASGDQPSYRDRLVAFYEAYAPNKVGSVDAQLEKYAGKEEELIEALVAKYGPEPAQATKGHRSSSRSSRTEVSTVSVHSRTASQIESAPPPSSGSYYDRLVAFYTKYAPNRVDQAARQLEKYAGREEDFFYALVQKYGPEPMLPAAAGGDQPSYRDRLVAFYEAYAPNKVGSVDAQLEKYAGNEEELMAALVAKYGPEPAPPAAAEDDTATSAAEVGAANSATNNEVRGEGASSGGERGAGEKLPGEFLTSESATKVFLSGAITDPERCETLLRIAEEMGVEVTSDATLRLLEALATARATPSGSNGENSAAKLAMFAHPEDLSTSATRSAFARLHGAVVATEAAASTAAEMDALAGQLASEEMAKRDRITLLESEDWDILWESFTRTTHEVEFITKLSVVRGEAESALMKQIWTTWRAAVVAELKRKKRAGQKPLTSYQRLVYTKSAHSYYKRLGAMEDQKLTVQTEKQKEKEKMLKSKRANLRKTVSTYGNKVDQNIISVVLGSTGDGRGASTAPQSAPEIDSKFWLQQETDNPRETVAFPFEKATQLRILEKQISPTRLAREARERGSFFHYADRATRLAAIEENFDCLPPDAKARVFRMLRKWDLIPIMPPDGKVVSRSGGERGASWSSTKPHAVEGSRPNSRSKGGSEHTLAGANDDVLARVERLVGPPPLGTDDEQTVVTYRESSAGRRSSCGSQAESDGSFDEEQLKRYMATVLREEMDRDDATVDGRNSH